MPFDIKCSILLIAALLMLALRVGEALAEPAKIAWSVEFDSPKDIETAKASLEGRSGATSPPPEVKDIKVENGILHFGGKFGPDSPPGHYVHIAWGSDVVNDAGQPIEVKDYPILEIRWRIEPRFAPYDISPQYDLYWQYKRQDGSEATAYTTGPYHAPGEWTVAKIRIAPDSSVPGSLTPKAITAVQLAVGARMCREPAWIDVDYIRIRAFTPEEAAAEQERIRRLTGYKPPDIPKRLKDVFFYGAYGVGSGYCGGVEGAFDELARCHMNLACGSNSDAETCKAAADRGIYLIASPGSIEHQINAGEIEAAQKAVDDLIAKTKDFDNIIGWYVRDEPLIVDLWGVVAAKQMLEQACPEKMGLYIIHSTDIIAYYDRFSTVAWTDNYPFGSGRRDPWSIGDWCRAINAASSKRHWFTPQAFGDAEWYRAKEKFDYYLPSREQFRLMMHLALANGAKAFGIFIYQVSLCAGLADPVGNPTALLEEATRLGEKWSAIGPLMLDARPITQPEVTQSSAGDPNHGVSVGAMGDPASGPVFLVATNEDLSTDRSGAVVLPAAWVKRDRAVYDLYSLKKITASVARGFEIGALAPGDGRIYALCTKDQFAVLKSAILKNAVEETLRVQGADRLIAQNWGINLAKYDSAVSGVRDLLKAGKRESALKSCTGKAAKALDVAVASDAVLVECRASLASAKAGLGKAHLAIYRGAEMVREGKEPYVDQLKKLSERYNDLRRRYICGEKADLAAQAKALQDEVGKLVESTGG